RPGGLPRPDHRPHRPVLPGRQLLPAARRALTVRRPAGPVHAQLQPRPAGPDHALAAGAANRRQGADRLADGPLAVVPGADGPALRPTVADRRQARPEHAVPRYPAVELDVSGG